MQTTINSIVRDVRDIALGGIKHPVALVLFIISGIGLTSIIESHRSGITQLAPSIQVGPMQYVENGQPVSASPYIKEATEVILFKHLADVFPESELLTKEQRGNLESRFQAIGRIFEHLQIEIPFSLTLQNKGSSNTTITELEVGLYAQLSDESTIDIIPKQIINISQLVAQGAIVTIDDKKMTISGIPFLIYWAEILKYVAQNRSRLPIEPEKFATLFFTLLKDNKFNLEDIKSFNAQLISQKAPLKFWIRIKGVLGEQIEGDSDLYLLNTPLPSRIIRIGWYPMIYTVHEKNLDVASRAEQTCCALTLLLALAVAICKSRPGNRLNEGAAAIVTLIVIDITLILGASFLTFCLDGFDIYAFTSPFENFPSWPWYLKLFGVNTLDRIVNYCAFAFYSFRCWNRGKIGERTFVIYSAYLLMDFISKAYEDLHTPGSWFWADLIYDLIGAICFCVFVPRIHRFVEGIFRVARLADKITHSVKTRKSHSSR